MPTDDSKQYRELKGKMENLSTGIKKHAGDENYPQNISAAKVEAQVNVLAEKRQDFEDATNIAHQKSLDYSTTFNACEDMFSKISTQLYGFHGKQNLIVEDYGLKIYQKPSGRKPKENNTKAN